ncbi:MAG: CopG family transcriptional regulator [Deltaproteobacteria bacterium]|nr:CopG family transcriptional regulator [Deltaproteobacteria bacterium]
MAKTVTTRLDDEYVKKIDELAARKGVDRSALLRSFLCLSPGYFRSRILG